MPHDGSLLQATVVFLLAVVLLVPLAQRLKMGAVPGYLLAGILIGPSVLGLLGNPDNVARLSEMGVVMLLSLPMIGHALGAFMDRIADAIVTG